MEFIIASLYGASVYEEKDGIHEVHTNSIGIVILQKPACITLKQPSTIEIEVIPQATPTPTPTHPLFPILKVTVQNL